MRLSEKGSRAIRTDRPRDLMVEGRRGLILRLEPRRDAAPARCSATGTSGTARAPSWSWANSPTASGWRTFTRCTAAACRRSRPAAIPAPRRGVSTAAPCRGPGGRRADGGRRRRGVPDVLRGEATQAAGGGARPPAAQRAAGISATGRRPASASATILVLDKIVERGSPVLANRVQALLKQCFAVAADRDLIESVPTFPRKKVGGEEAATHARAHAMPRSARSGADSTSTPQPSPPRRHISAG